MPLQQKYISSPDKSISFNIQDMSLAAVWGWGGGNRPHLLHFHLLPHWQTFPSFPHKCLLLSLPTYQSVILLYSEWYICFCETQPTASIGWVALSSVVRSVVPHSDISSYIHYMMFLSIQTIYFLWGYDPGNMSVSTYLLVLSWAQFTVV